MPDPEEELQLAFNKSVEAMEAKIGELRSLLQSPTATIREKTECKIALDGLRNSHQAHLLASFNQKNIDRTEHLKQEQNQLYSLYQHHVKASSATPKEVTQWLTEMNNEMGVKRPKLEHLNLGELKQYEAKLKEKFKSIELGLQVSIDRLKGAGEKLESMKRLFSKTERLYKDELEAIQLIKPGKVIKQRRIADAIRSGEKNPLSYMDKVNAAKGSQRLDGEQEENYRLNLRELIIQPLKTATTDLRNLKEKSEAKEKAIETQKGKLKEAIKTTQGLLDKLPDLLKKEARDVIKDAEKTIKSWEKSPFAGPSWFSRFIASRNADNPTKQATASKTVDPEGPVPGKGM